jgi:hypothetical protein
MVKTSRDSFLKVKEVQDDLDAISLLGEKGLTPNQIADSIEKINGLQASASEIDGKVIPVGTITLLRAKTSTPSTVWVSGYYTKGDGAFGSNIFEWDSTSTEDDNGGTIIKLTSITTGRYKLRYSGAVNIKWFGAKGDGVTVDDISFKNAWKYATIFNIFTTNRTSKRLYLPSGTYLITENNFLNNSQYYYNYTGYNYEIYGEGKGQTCILFKPTINEALMYDQSLPNAPAFSGLLFKDIRILFNNSDINGGDIINGFKCVAVSGKATQAFKFDNVQFTGVPKTTVIIANGNVNESENKFINCSFSTIKTLLDINNLEAVNHTIVASDFENIYGDLIIAKKGGQTQIFGGSIIFNSETKNECSIFSTGEDYLVSGFSNCILMCYGVRGEFRGEFSRVLNIKDNNLPLTILFDACVFAKFDYSQDFAECTIQNNGNIIFRNCILPSSTSKFRFKNNPTPVYQYAVNNLIKSYLLFDGCRTAGDVTVGDFYHSFSSVTDSDLLQSQVVEHSRCNNIQNGVSYGSRYGSGKSYNPTFGNILKFRGLTFPWSNGTTAQDTSDYFNVEIPYKAYVEKIVISRASFAGYSSIDYSIEIVDEKEFLSTGSGTIYGYTTVQKFNLAMDFTIPIRKRFSSSDSSEMKLWLRLKSSSGASGPVKSDVGVVYAVCL